MPFDFFSSASSFADFGDVASVVDTSGSEFLSSIGAVGDFGTSFDVPISDLASVDAWAATGSFAGSADWFDTFNSGSILSSIPSVGDFNFSSITDSFPSLSSITDGAKSLGDSISAGYTAVKESLPSLDKIKSVANTVSKEVGTITKDAQKVLSAYQKVAPAVNAASNALGIQNPLNQIIQPLTAAVSVAGATASAAGGVSSGIDSARKTGSSISDFFGPSPTEKAETYNQAVKTVESTDSALKQYDSEKATYTADIVRTSDNIYNINQRLEDPNTSAEERALLEEQLKGEYATLAEKQQVLEQTNTAIEQVTSARNSAEQVIANTDSNVLGQAAAVATAGASQFKTAYDSVTKTWSVFDARTGQTVQTGLTEQQAILAGQDLNLTNGISLNTAAAAVAGIVNLGTATASDVALAFDPVASQNAITAALTNQARAQQTVRELRNTKAQSTDWRVRLKLAPNSNYLYNSPSPGILAALKLTDGVIFPYTPSIETAYKANYDAYDLTHSNYRGYFYKGSYVDAVNVRGTFTAQDTKEGDYLLAVIHFFRSCTKMFYGKDTQRGSPPPLVYLNGYGDYQFAEHPCVVSQFNYTLPPDVDYIRCQSTLQNNTNRLNSRLRNPLANNPLSYSVNRLLNSNLVAGALNNAPLSLANNLASSTPTYVPTKMEISITLLPIQSRSQISNNFSVKEFANGNLLKGGYW